MRPASALPSSYLSQPSWRSRALAGAVSLGIALLIVAMLIMLGVVPPIVKPSQPDLVTVHLSPNPPTQAVRARKAAKATPSGGAPAHVPVPRPAPTAKAEAKTPTTPWNVLSLSASEMAAADISKMPSHADDAQAGGGGSGAGAGKDSGADYGPGAGPGGEQLYNAEWYRRPSHAELATYMPANGPSEGWAMVACRTAERFHVEDCRELGETPGSGFSRALRQAAWQFLVRPPMRNGQPMIGVWVRIRFDWSPKYKDQDQ